MSDKNRLLVGLLLVPLAASFVMVIVLFAQEVPSASRQSTQSGNTPTLWASLSLVAFGDTALALTLVVLLYRRRSHVPFTRTASMIDRIILYTIGTGVLTAAFNLAGLVTSLAMRHNLVNAMLLEMLPKCKSKSPAICTCMYIDTFSCSIPQLHAYIVRLS